MNDQTIEQIKLFLEDSESYRALSDRQIAELFVSIIEALNIVDLGIGKIALRKGRKGDKGDKGDKGEPGKDAQPLRAGVDYYTRSEQEQLIRSLIAQIPTVKGEKGDDAEITPEMIDELVTRVYSLIDIPEPEVVREDIEELEEKIEDLEEKVSKVRKETSYGGGMSRAAVQQLINDSSSDGASTFEKLSKNLSDYAYSINYSSGNISSIDYTAPSGIITKTINYTSGDVTSIVLSGVLPSDLTVTTKTISYSGGNISSIAYS